MNVLSRLSIRTRLALVMTAVLAFISLSIIVYMPSRLQRQSFNALMQKAAALGEMSAVTLAPNLEEHDRSGVAEALTAVRRNPDLVFLVVEDVKGQRFATFSDLLADDADYPHIDMHPIAEGSLLAPQPDNTVHRESVGGFTAKGDIFVTKTPIRWLGKLVGTLYLGFTTEHVHEDTARSRATIAFATLLA